MRLHQAIAGILLLGVWTSAGLSAAPPDPLAFVRVDPRRFAASPAWLAALLRITSQSGVIRPEDQAVVDAVLVATTLGTHPHLLTLLDLGDVGRDERGRLTVGRLQAIVSIHAPGRLADLRRSMQTILSHYGDPARRRQAPLQLPDGRAGVHYRVDDWPSWLCVDWFAEGDTLHVGLGRDTLARWLAAPRGSPPVVQPHLDALADLPAGHADRPLLLRGFVDFARLRRQAPTLFHTGRLTPILQTLSLQDADQVMIEGRWHGTLAVLGLTVARADAVRAMPLTLDHWPADAAVPQPPGRFHLVATLGDPGWVRRIVELVKYTKEPSDRAKVDRWVRQHWGPDAARLIEHVQRYEPMLLVSDHPRSWLPLPGTATLYAALRPGENAAEAEAELASLLAPAMHAGEADDVTIVRDAPTGLAWLDSPVRGLFKSPAWGWAEDAARPTLIVSYSPHAVLANRRWLTETRRPPKLDALEPSQE